MKVIEKFTQYKPISIHEQVKAALENCDLDNEEKDISYLYTTPNRKHNFSQLLGTSSPSKSLKNLLNSEPIKQSLPEEINLDINSHSEIQRVEEEEPLERVVAEIGKKKQNSPFEMMEEEQSIIELP